MLVRSDGRPAYNFAVVVDDALMEITHVIRGEDHISNTPRQVLLYRALGFGPPRFAHLSLVLGPDHTPLSKRHGATSVAEFRERGYLPEALTNYLALIGWSPRTGGGETADDAELMPIDELARRFALEDVGHSAGVFDPEKLAWMNRHYMKIASPARIAAESGAVLPGARVPQAARPTSRWPTSSRCCRWRWARSIAWRRFPIASRSCSTTTPQEALQRPAVAEVLHEPGAREVIAALAEAIDGPLLDRERSARWPTRVKEKTGQKGKALFHPIRVALTGEGGGPELDLAVPAIDRGAQLSQDAGAGRRRRILERPRERAEGRFAAVASRARPG